MAVLHIDTGTLEGYRLFLAVKGLPRYRFVGRTAEVPDEYLHALGMAAKKQKKNNYNPLLNLFDYQRDISALAIRKEKFAAFVKMGYGKTLILWEFVRHAVEMMRRNQCFLIVSPPPPLIRQTIGEGKRFYGDGLAVEHVRAADLQAWLINGKSRVGITTYNAIKKGLRPGRLGGLGLDESSYLKSHYGAWGKRLISLGRGLRWKLYLTGTPAPNDRIEFANHAVFLDQFPTVNAFLARFFVNKGKTEARWEMKPHALRAFYRALSHWSIFMTNPATYGWKDNVGAIPPIHVHIHDVKLTDEQREMVCKAGGDMHGNPGGITSRSKLSQLAKGMFNGKQIPTNKPAFIRDLISSWPDESTLVWTIFNHEQDSMEKAIPGAVGIRGKTSEDERERIIADFKAGRLRNLVSKDRCLGFGLNLQIATRQVFSGIVDSYEKYAQCVARSNRVGSTLPLNVHLPVTPIERPMMETVLKKAHRVATDEAEQESMFKEQQIA